MRLTYLLSFFLALSAGGAHLAVAAPCNKATKPYERLAQGRKLIEAGESQRAITECFQPVIDSYETKADKKPTVRRYSAQNQMQVILYAALPDEKMPGVEVMDGDWADAYLMKAYALIELKNIPEAQDALAAAIRLSPMNPQYQSELGYTYQVLKQCDASIESYRAAASVAELGSTDDRKLEDLGLAWRGEGYCLVEQGKLDEAEAVYRKALAANPKDRKSQAELEYVEGLRKK
jgi:tetratricopeptide (TPR) repeat protein